MMKSIEEAIEHALAKADELGERECGKDHRQLAEWLTELRDYKTGATPLADRLTIEEKDLVRDVFAWFKKVEERAAYGTYGLGYYQGILVALKDIFGTAMFEEKGGLTNGNL